MKKPGNRGRNKGRMRTLADVIVRVLNENGVLAVHFKKAVSGSCYVKLPGLGSLRIADHDGIERYRYRWNIRLDQTTSPRIETDRGTVRRYYPATEDGLRQFCRDVIAEKKNIKKEIET